MAGNTNKPDLTISVKDDGSIVPDLTISVKDDGSIVIDLVKKKTDDLGERKTKAGKIDPWTEHLLRLRKLQKAGYPFGKDDLSYDEWRDLGTLTQVIEAMKQ